MAAMSELVRPRDGLTKAEGRVMDALCDAANAFGDLPHQHPSEDADFVNAIHRCQDLLAIRVARRQFPQGWPMYRPNRHGAEIDRLIESAP
jgi:hypothetical protein